MARPTTRAARRAAASALAASLLLTSLPAGAAVVIFGRFPVQQLLLVIGTPSPAVIDTVTMDAPAATLGNPGNPVPGAQPIDVTILARAPTGAPNFTLTVDSSQPLRSAANDTVPMSEIAWTSDAGDVPAGRFTGSTAQVLLSAPPDRLIRDTLRFRYLNSTVPPAGTYRSQVRYTLSVP